MSTTYSLDIEVSGPLQVVGWPKKGVPSPLADDPAQWHTDLLKALTVNVTPLAESGAKSGEGQRARFAKTSGLAFLRARRRAPPETTIVYPRNVVWCVRVEASDAEQIASLGEQQRLRLRVTFCSVRAGQFVGIRSRARVLLR